MADTQEFLDKELDKFYLNCVEMVKRNIVLLNNAKDVEDYDRMMSQRAVNPQDLIEDTSDLYKAELKQAILQHFQQEQERVDDSPPPLDHEEVFVCQDCGMTTSDRGYALVPREQYQNMYTQTQVDRLIREARGYELWLIMANPKSDGSADWEGIQKRYEEITFGKPSKQKEGSKEA